MWFMLTRSERPPTLEVRTIKVNRVLWSSDKPWWWWRQYRQNRKETNRPTVEPNLQVVLLLFNQAKAWRYAYTYLIINDHRSFLLFSTWPYGIEMTLPILFFFMLKKIKLVVLYTHLGSIGGGWRTWDGVLIGADVLDKENDIINTWLKILLEIFMF